MPNPLTPLSAPARREVRRRRGAPEGRRQSRARPSCTSSDVDDRGSRSAARPLGAGEALSRTERSACSRRLRTDRDDSPTATSCIVCACKPARMRWGCLLQSRASRRSPTTARCSCRTTVHPSKPPRTTTSADLTARSSHSQPVLPDRRARGRIYLTCRDSYVRCAHQRRRAPSGAIHVWSPSRTENECSRSGCCGSPTAFVVFAGGCLLAVSSMHLDFHFGPTTRPCHLHRRFPSTGRGTRSGPRRRPQPAELYHGAYPSDDQTQERQVGGLPARFSGYTTWVRSVSGCRPASTSASIRAYLPARARHRVQPRQVRPARLRCDFFVWTQTAGLREADAIAARTLSPDTTMRSGALRDGDVYLYVGTVPGPYYVVYNPDARARTHEHSSRRWRVPSCDECQPIARLSTPTAPPTTPG